MSARSKRPGRRRRNPANRTLCDVAQGDYATLEDGNEVMFHMGTDTFVLIDSERKHMPGDTPVTAVRFRERAIVENGQVSDPLLSNQTALPLFAHAKRNQ